MRDATSRSRTDETVSEGASKAPNWQKDASFLVSLGDLGGTLGRVPPRSGNFHVQETKRTLAVVNGIGTDIGTDEL